MEGCREDVDLLRVGERCLYGKIIHVWDDPTSLLVQWVVIRNDSVHSPIDSFSIYRHQTNISGSLSTFHFIPACILKNLSQLSIEDFTFGERIDHRSYLENTTTKSKRKKKAATSSTPAATSSVSKAKQPKAVTSKVVKSAKELTIKESTLKAVTSKGPTPVVSAKSSKNELPFNDIIH